MRCEKCKKRDATVHLTEIARNVKSEIHLCEYCAKQFGLNSRLSSFSISVPDMLSFLDIEEVGSLKDRNLCQSCGLTYMEYRKNGKLGCVECYKYLSDALKAVVTGYHGSSKHIGKVPFSYVEVGADSNVQYNSNVSVIEKAETVDSLKIKLDGAVMEERYEDAARIRDMISEAERNGD